VFEVLFFSCANSNIPLFLSLNNGGSITTMANKKTSRLIMKNIWTISSEFMCSVPWCTIDFQIQDKNKS